MPSILCVERLLSPTSRHSGQYSPARRMPILPQFSFSVSVELRPVGELARKEVPSSASPAGTHIILGMPTSIAQPIVSPTAIVSTVFFKKTHSTLTARGTHSRSTTVPTGSPLICPDPARFGVIWVTLDQGESARYFGQKKRASAICGLRPPGIARRFCPIPQCPQNLLSTNSIHSGIATLSRHCTHEKVGRSWQIAGSSPRPERAPGPAGFYGFARHKSPKPTCGFRGTDCSISRAPPERHSLFQHGLVGCRSPQRREGTEVGRAGVAVPASCRGGRQVSPCPHPRPAADAAGAAPSPLAGRGL